MNRPVVSAVHVEEIAYTGSDARKSSARKRNKTYQPPPHATYFSADVGSAECALHGNPEVPVSVSRPRSESSLRRPSVRVPTLLSYVPVEHSY